MPFATASTAERRFNRSRFLLGRRTQCGSHRGLGGRATRKIMRLSTERILTTHVGSLPRSSEVVDLLYKKDSGEPYDRAAFDAAITAGVADAVVKQVAAGVD